MNRLDPIEQFIADVDEWRQQHGIDSAAEQLCRPLLTHLHVAKPLLPAIETGLQKFECLEDSQALSIKAEQIKAMILLLQDAIRRCAASNPFQWEPSRNFRLLPTHLNAMKRKIDYRLAGQPFWQITELVFHLTIHPMMMPEYIQESGPSIASRLMWLQLQPKGFTYEKGKNRYPNREHPLYPMDRLRSELPAKHHWLLQELPQDFVWRAFLTLVRLCMTLTKHHLEQYIDDRMEYYGVDKANAPSVEVFTTPHTEKASSDDEVTECRICQCDFSHEKPDEEDTEAAVKLPCNHLLGKECLQNWVNSGHNTCPYCMRELFGYGFTLPLAIREGYPLLLGVIESVQDLDQDIDKMLQGGFVQFPDAEFGRVLHAMMLCIEKRDFYMDHIKKQLRLLRRVRTPQVGVLIG
jgi:hypothetical protein